MVCVKGVDEAGFALEGDCFGDPDEALAWDLFCAGERQHEVVPVCASVDPQFVDCAKGVYSLLVGLLCLDLFQGMLGL